MAYLGNTVQTAFTSFDKQDLTGSSGTGPFTLTHAVANENELQVFISNVRQEPTEAYTCSGNQITLTGAVSASDDFYVLFSGKALQTASHPSYLPLAATTGTFSGAVSAASATVTGDLTVDTDTLYVDSANNRVGMGTTNPLAKLHTYGADALMRLDDTNGGISFIGHDATGAYWRTFGTDTHRFLRASGVESMRIDSSGNVTMPAQPMFAARGNNQAWYTVPTATTWMTFIGGTTHSSTEIACNWVDSGTGLQNRGSHFSTSTGLFTAPVSGFYLFTFSAYCHQVPSGTRYFYLNSNINGGIQGDYLLFGYGLREAGQYSEGVGQQQIRYLSANDTFCFSLYQNAASSFNFYLGYVNFTGALLG